MKKNLFFAALCGVALLFAACGPEEGDELQNIKVKPESVELAEGATTRLSVTFTPENLKTTPEIQWSTNDSTVAIVSANGTVTAVGRGNAIITAQVQTATAELKSECQVTVKDYYETIVFTGAYLGIKDTVGELTDTLSPAGDTTTKYICKRIPISLVLFTDGFYLSDAGELSGTSTGTTIEMETTMAYAPGWANGSDKGTYFCLGTYRILPDWDSEEYKKKSLIGKPYSIDNAAYIPNLVEFITNYMNGDEATAYSVNLKAASSCIEGPVLTTYIYHTTAEGYGQDGYYSAYMPELLVKYAQFDVNNNFVGSNVMFNIERHDILVDQIRSETQEGDGDQYIYGVKFDYTQGQGYTLADAENVYVNADAYNFLLGNEEDEAAERVAKRNIWIPVENIGSMEQTAAITKMLHSLPAEKQIVK